MAAFKSLLVVAYIALRAQAQGTTASASASASASACASTITPKHAAPSVASGWRADVVANKLNDPRGLLFDDEGGLLVVEQNRGISRITFNKEQDGCVRKDGDAELIINDASLNHGIALSEDSKTLYASSSTAVYAWDYDASQGRNTSGPREVIVEMDGNGHTSRTLLLSRKAPGLLLVSRGSQGNLDYETLDVQTGVSTIKAFNVTNVTDSAYNFPEDGLLLGWGLRNSVGVAEEPVTGGIYSVENSVDNFNRSNESIHQNNPGEEMNFHGFLNGTESDEQGGNYGYPTCFAAWNVDEIPDNEGIQVGMQIAIGEQNSTLNDTFCREDRIAPRLTFQAHQAPLDIKFNQNGTAAWVTFHGSWNRDDPIGYKLSYIAFDGAGSPVAPSNSSNSTIDIVSNGDLSKCPDECIRPVGLAWDSEGRLFMSSDATGEIWVVTREDGGSAEDASPSSGLPPSATESAPAQSSSPGAANANVLTVRQFVVVWAGIMASLI
ncbi:hypothetical protein N0V90_006711 [Kalmusia sp. IMI 367209]|nr:hypothetical protein N0V90_006711 [Kalmusia sp. IMI 367209]